LRILITGATGFAGARLGVHLAQRYDVLGIGWRAQRMPPFPCERADLTNADAISAVVTAFRPQAIVHLAAMSRVIGCEDHSEQARDLNVYATARLVIVAAKLRAKFIFISTDQVFSGRRGIYRESDEPGPVGVYGRTKLEAERIVLSSEAQSLVIRSNSIVGASRCFGESFSDRILHALRRGETADLFQDQYRSPIHIRQLVQILEAGCTMEFSGLLHVGGSKRMSRLDTGYAVARAYGLSADGIHPVSYLSHPRAVIMTADTSYDITRLKQAMPFLAFPPLDDDFIADARDARQAP
jgi:dTDP-4-dehydrorhamnose reductase